MHCSFPFSSEQFWHKCTSYIVREGKILWAKPHKDKLWELQSVPNLSKICAFGSKHWFKSGRWTESNSHALTTRITSQTVLNVKNSSPLRSSISHKAEKQQKNHCYHDAKHEEKYVFCSIWRHFHFYSLKGKIKTDPIYQFQIKSIFITEDKFYPFLHSYSLT